MLFFLQYSRKDEVYPLIKNIKFEFSDFIRRLQADFKNIHKIAFIAIFLMGIFFRIVAFGAHCSLHIDEAIYANWSADIGYNYNILCSTSGLDKPPLFHYLTGLFIFLFGPNDQSIKFTGLLMGIMMIPLAMLIALNLGRKSSALWVGFFLALSPFEILYAPTGFSETTCIFFCLTALLALIYRIPIVTGVFIGLALATKQSVVFFLPLYGIFFYLRFSHYIRDLKKIAFGFLIVLIPLLFWAAFISDKGLSIFLAIYKKRFFTPAENSMQLIEWLKLEKFFTGNWYTTIFSFLAIAAARIIYTVDILRNRRKHVILYFSGVFSILLFIVGYDSLISIMKYPLYSRYLLVISSSYIILFGLSFDLVLKKLFLRQKRKFNIITVLVVLLIGYWIIKTKHDMKLFPDGANYKITQAIKPCTDYIKDHSEQACIYYTDEMWPWVGWYFFAQRQKKLVIRTPANFTKPKGIQQVLDNVKKDYDELQNKTIYFIVNPEKDKNVFALLEKTTGTKPEIKKEFTSQPSDSKHHSYIVYSVDLKSLSTP